MGIKNLKIKVNHGDHGYSKQLKDPLEKCLCVFLQKNALNVVLVSFTLRSNFMYLTFQKRKKHQSQAF